MNKCVVCLFFILCYFNLYTARSLDLNEYLNQKFRDLQENLIEKPKLLQKRDVGIMIKIKESKQPELRDYIETVLISNIPHLLTKGGLYEITNNSTNLLHQKEVLSEKKIQNENVTFAKSITFNGIGFLLIYSNLSQESHIYQLSNGSFDYKWVQTVLTPDAKDGHFFINNNNLYLVVANNKGEGLAETLIYKWLGFHFDEIQTVFTTGAIKVGSFTTRTAEIIIILQDIPNKALPSVVLKFSNEEVKKIQLLKTYHAINLDTYTSKNKNYVIIFTQSRHNMVYEWKETHLDMLRDFETEEMVYHCKSITVNNTSIVEVSFNNKLQIYQINRGQIKLKNEIQYSTNYSKIIDIEIALSRENDKILETYIIGLDERNFPGLKIISSSFNFGNSSEKVLSSDTGMLRNCFNSLDTLLQTLNKNLNETKNELLKDDIHTNVILSESLVKETSVENEIRSLKKKFSTLNSTMNNYTIPSENDLIINGETIIESNVEAEQLTAHNIILRNINGQKWIPEQWLRYRQPQTISGLSKIMSITASEVKISPTNPIFKDVLLNTGNQVIDGPISIDDLSVSKIYAHKINGIPMDQVYFKNKPEKINGVKTFKYIDVDDADVITINEDTPDVLISSVLTAFSNVDFNSNITVENLEVETINGVSWDKFKDSVFRINKTKEINGPITFKNIRAKNLVVNKIKDKEVKNLLTSSTDQIIEANMTFAEIFTNRLNVNFVNGIKIPEDVVFINESTTIHGPVKMDKLKVLHNLTHFGKVSGSFFLKNGDHIIGTNESDFLQKYSGKVVIDGNLHLTDLNLLENTNLFVSGTKVNTNFTDDYWTKNSNQKIPVHVNFLQSVTVPHLLTEVINNVKFGQYLLNDNEDKLETDYKFEKVAVSGNVILRNTATHKPDLNKIMEEAVRTTGSFIIHDKKTYLNTLKTENLQTRELEGIKVSEALNKKRPQDVTGSKTIKNLIVKNDAVSKFNNVETINNIHLKDFMKNLVFIDQPINITNLDFENLNVVDVNVQQLNDHNIEDYMPFPKKIKDLNIINNLTITGNVTIHHIQNMEFLNGFSYKDLVENGPKIGEVGIQHPVEFAGKVKVKNLLAEHINSFNLRNLTRSVLNRKYPQIITANFTFTNLKADNILAKKINQVSVEDLIDVHSTSPQKIFAPNGTLSLSDVIVGYLQAPDITPCSLDLINTELADPPTQKWKEIIIKGNVTSLDEGCFLYRLLKKSVKLNSRNVIHAEVKMLSNVLIKNLHTKNVINNIDVLSLLEDAVLTESEAEQKITGIKWFTTLQTSQAHVLGNADANFLNNQNITALNDDIVDKNEGKVIRGKKTFFNGLQTNKFNTTSIPTESIVDKTNPNVIPEAIIDTFSVRDNLNIKVYNRTTFSDFLDNRLLTDGVKIQAAKGIYYFEQLEAYNLTTPNINDIKIEDIVFDIGTQEIAAKKTFKYPVTVNGNISVDYINGVNIINEMKNSIPLRGAVDIEGSITILQPTTIKSVITAESINGVPIALIKDILSFNKSQIETEAIYLLKQQLIEKINKDLPIEENLTNEFLYLEHSNNLQVKIPNASSASATNFNNRVLIQVNGLEPGSHCNLPGNCSCPVQSLIEISPHHSVNILSNRTNQRIFSYDDDNININFITNTVSKSSFCRTVHSKVYGEVSMMTWSIKTPGTRQNVFYQYEKFLNGYISKVDFFTSNNKTYAVVGRYYDSVIDSYHLDCTVLRICENKTTALEVQIIPTSGVQEVYLLPTAQGILLILGNKVPSDINHEREETQIFRFRPDKEQFVLLRTIPSFGCSSASGVVLGSDSLITLAHEEAPAKVLKYYPEFDNYYLYQSFEEPVIGISTFYLGGFGISDAYLCLITANEGYKIYSYRFLEGFKLKSTGKLEGLRNFAPFELNMQTYLFAPSSKKSSLLTVVKNGSI